MGPVKIDYSENAERIPGFLLWQVSKLWQRSLAEALKDLNISSTQAVILGNLVRWTEMGKLVTQIMLSEQTKIDPMTTSQAIRTLEKKSMVNRVPSRIDGRAYLIEPTISGTETAHEALQRFVKAHLDFFGPIDADIEEFAKQLQKLIQNNSS